MELREIVTPSSQVDATLPVWIRSPDVVIPGGELTSYSQENHRNFVNFMTLSAETQERSGFGQDLLQNLLTYKDFNTYRNPIITYNILSVNGSIGSGTSYYKPLDTSDYEHILAARPQGQALNILVGIPLEEDDLIVTEDETDHIELADGYGFPEENGVILIDDEVILYRRKVGNTLYDLRRGSSGTSILPTYRQKGKYHHKTKPARHYAGSVVYNLSVLFLVSILDQIHKTYAHNIDSSRVVPEINRDTLLKNIKDFFKSKGSKLGIKALFKILFNENDVDVFYPGDRMIKPSESTWVKSMILRTTPVPETFCDPRENYALPDKTIGSEVFFKSYSAVVINDKGEEVQYLEDDVFAKTYSEYSTSYQYGDETQYEIYLNKEDLEGEIIPNPNTRLTRNLYRAGVGESNDERRDTTTITCESTLGFPQRGVIFIDNEAIFYSNKTNNQFLDCKRGYIGVNRFHSKGAHVYGPYYIETRIIDDEGIEYVSRSFPLGLVESVEVHDPGLLHKKDDVVIVNGPGRYDFREQILVSLENDLDRQTIVPTFLENYNDDLVTQKSSSEDEIKYVGNRTHGPDGIYYDNDYVYVSSSGFPSYEIGYFNTDVSIPVEDKVGPLLVSDELFAVIPRRLIIKDNIIRDRPDIKYIYEYKGTDIIGVFVDGVRAYSNVSPKRITQGRITEYKVDKTGFGYKNPTLIVSPSKNTNHADVEVSEYTGEILSIKPTSSAFFDSFIDTPSVRITSGELGLIRLYFDNYGRIVNTRISHQGRYYNDIPSLRVVDETGRGKGAVLSCDVKYGSIYKVDIVNSGIDYNKDNTRVEVIPVGSGAEVTPVVEYYEIDRYSEIMYNDDWKFDDGNGFLFEPPVGVDKKYYGYVCNPESLRSQLDDNGSQHSPIIGWAFDGNPIYGPYGYTNKVDNEDGVERQVSAYKLLHSRNTIIPGGGTTSIGLTPPSISEYPMGSLVQDYVYSPDDYMIEGIVPEPIDGLLASEIPEFIQTEKDQELLIRTTDGPGIGLVYPNFLLDENNGKVCNTPDFPQELYPDGVYCYFITLHEDELTPAFPYIVGKTFNNRPISQRIDIQSHESVSALPMRSAMEYKPYVADDVIHTFDFKNAERLRNPYIEDTNEEVKLEIGEVSDGSISDIIIETGLPITTSVGDRVFFDNSDAGGAGAQGVVTQIKGKAILEARGEEINTFIVSHHQRLDLRSNLDQFNNPRRFTIADDSKLTTFDYSYNSQVTTITFDDDRNYLDVKTTSSTLPRNLQYSYDNRRRLFQIKSVQTLPETMLEDILWFENTEHFFADDVVLIKNGSLYDNSRPHEKVKIKKVSTLIDFIPNQRYIYDIIDAGKSIPELPDDINGGIARLVSRNILDSGTSADVEYPSVNRKVEVARAYDGTEPKPIDDFTEIVNTERYFYTLFLNDRHYLKPGDLVEIRGSSFPEVNGFHEVVKTPLLTTFSIYVSELYGTDNANVSYSSTAPTAQGEPLEIKVTSPGYGYNDLPKLLGLYKKFDDRGEFIIKTGGTSITGVEIVNSGARYVAPKAIFMDYQNRGRDAEADVEVENGRIKSITMTNNGIGYVDPILYLVETDGKYICTTDDIGKIKSMKVINPGRNIPADRTIKPEIVIDSKVVVDYIEEYEELVIDGGSATFQPYDIIDGGSLSKSEYPPFNINRLPYAEIYPFKEGEMVYQGTEDKYLVTAVVKSYDAHRQILSLKDVNGILQSGEPLYNKTGTKANVILEGQSDCRCVINGTSVPEGRYIDDTSMISESYAVIQDSHRYQWFSYVISSPIQQRDYGEFVKEIVHPSGFIQFADLTLHSSVDSKTKVGEEEVISKY